MPPVDSAQTISATIRPRPTPPPSAPTAALPVATKLSISTAMTTAVGTTCGDAAAGGDNGFHRTSSSEHVTERPDDQTSPERAGLTVTAAADSAKTSESTRDELRRPSEFDSASNGRTEPISRRAFDDLQSVDPCQRLLNGDGATRTEL